MLSPSALRLDLLPPATAAVLAKLAQEPALSGFCLVGGTALALQAGHRRSLDLDLVRFSPTLDKQALFSALRAQGAELITPQSAISAARINGLDLLTRVQDYVLDGIKVQFFTYPEGLRHAPDAKRRCRRGKRAFAGWSRNAAKAPRALTLRLEIVRKQIELNINISRTENSDGG